MAKICDKCKVEFKKDDEIVPVDFNKGQEDFEICEKCTIQIIKYIKTPEKKGWF